MLEEKTRVWTIRSLMKFAIDHLQRRGIDEARLNVELLLSHALQCKRIELYTNFDKPLAAEELKAFRSLYERRLNREPVQYIVGGASFMGMQFKVDSRVLIPRPETETLVEQAMLVSQKAGRGQPCSIMEIGTGSGNIVISLAKFVKGAKLWTIDVSEEALALARENAEYHGVSDRIVFERMDAFEPVDQLLLRRFDLLVSNPPYVSAGEWEELQHEFRRFEPRVAVSDWKDGLEFYRRLVELAPYLLRDQGTMIVEVGYGQAETVARMMTDAHYEDVGIVPDLQHIPRVVMGKTRSIARNPGFVN